MNKEIIPDRDEHSYIYFELIKKYPKTNRYAVVSRKFGDVIGNIYWFGGWRQYVFEAEPAIIWNRDCLTEIIAFIEFLMEKRKHE